MPDDADDFGGLDAGKLLRRRLRADLLLLRYGVALRGLRHYALFIGYPRSGHTLVAALLDAHPRIVFANGLDAAQYFGAGLGVRRVAALSIWNSRRFTRSGRRSNGYDYTVPGGWHGRWQSLAAVGDKSGDLLSARLRRAPLLLDRLHAVLGESARFIHVVRNPFDCIASISVRGNVTLLRAAADFFGLCEANAWARARTAPQAWHDVYLEQLIEEPRTVLEGLCRFLGVEASDEYVAACTRLVLRAPHRASLKASWDPFLVESVSERMRAYPWLAGYGIEPSGRGAGPARAA